MRGVVSHGMMISAEELALPGEWFEDGIIQLETPSPPGADAVEAVGLGAAVLDVEITSNRPDAMSVLGLARELAASYGVPLQLPSSRDPARRRSLRRKRGTFPESSDCHRFVAQRFDGFVRCAGAGMDADSVGAGGATSDQQSRGRLELRDARDRAAASRL